MGGSGCVLAPGELQAQQGQLLGAALALLTHHTSSDAVVEAAAQLLLLVFGPENFAADEQADLAATAALAQALLATHGRLAGAESDTLPAAVAKLASAATERAPEFVCGQMPQVGVRMRVLVWRGVVLGLISSANAAASGALQWLLPPVLSWSECDAVSLPAPSP